MTVFPRAVRSMQLCWDSVYVGGLSFHVNLKIECVFGYKLFPGIFSL